MDSTIVTSLIGFSGVVIAALIGHFAGKKSGSGAAHEVSSRTSGEVEVLRGLISNQASEIIELQDDAKILKHHVTRCEEDHAFTKLEIEILKRANNDQIKSLLEAEGAKIVQSVANLISVMNNKS